MPKLWRAPIPMVRITAPQMTGIQKLRGATSRDGDADGAEGRDTARSPFLGAEVGRGM
jgi:hypothetical protein